MLLTQPFTAIRLMLFVSSLFFVVGCTKKQGAKSDDLTPVAGSGGESDPVGAGGDGDGAGGDGAPDGAGGDGAPVGAGGDGVGAGGDGAPVGAGGDGVGAGGDGNPDGAGGDGDGAGGDGVPVGAGGDGDGAGGDGVPDGAGGDGDGAGGDGVPDGAGGDGSPVGAGGDGVPVGAGGDGSPVGAGGDGAGGDEVPVGAGGDGGEGDGACVLTPPSNVHLAREGDEYFLRWRFLGDAAEEGLESFNIYYSDVPFEQLEAADSDELDPDTTEFEITPQEGQTVYLQLASVGCEDEVAPSPQFQVRLADTVVALVQTPDGMRVENFTENNFGRLLAGENLEVQQDAPIQMKTYISPDKNWLAVEGDLETSGKNELWLADLRNQAFRWHKIDGGVPGGDARGSIARQKVLFSPDSRFLAFVADFEVQNKQDAWVVDLREEALAPLKMTNASVDNAQVLTLEFSPNSRWLSIRGNLEMEVPGFKFAELWVRDLTDQDAIVQKVSNQAGNVRADNLRVDSSGFSPNSRWLGFSQPESVTNKFEFWLVDLLAADLSPTKITTTSAPGEALFALNQSNDAFQFSPNSRWVVTAGPMDILRKVEVWLTDLNEPLGTSFEKISVSIPDDELPDGEEGEFYELSAQPPKMKFSNNSEWLALKGTFNRGTSNNDLFLVHLEDALTADGSWILASPNSAMSEGDIIGFEFSPDSRALIFDSNIKRALDLNVSHGELYQVDFQTAFDADSMVQSVDDVLISSTDVPANQANDIGSFGFFNQRPLVFAEGSLNFQGKKSYYFVDPTDPAPADSWMSISDFTGDADSEKNAAELVLSEDENWFALRGDLEVDEKQELWVGPVNNYLDAGFAPQKVSLSADALDPSLDIASFNTQFSQDGEWLLFEGDLDIDNTNDVWVTNPQNPDALRTNLTEGADRSARMSDFRKEFQLFVVD